MINQQMSIRVKDLDTSVLTVQCLRIPFIPWPIFLAVLGSRDQKLVILKSCVISFIYDIFQLSADKLIYQHALEMVRLFREKVFVEKIISSLSVAIMNQQYRLHEIKIAP